MRRVNTGDGPTIVNIARRGSGGSGGSGAGAGAGSGAGAGGAGDRRGSSGGDCGWKSEGVGRLLDNVGGLSLSREQVEKVGRMYNEAFKR